MDVTTAIGSVLAAFGLSGAAGLNAWLPLFVSALLDRLGVVELAAPFDSLSTTTGLVVLGVLLVADFIGDKIPAVDHVLHALGSVVHPLAGAVLFTGPTGAETELPTAVSAVAGALIAGSFHAARATVRPLSTAGTAGAGNPLLSLGEDGASAVLTLFAFALPVLAFLIVVALAAAMFVAVRRARRALRKQSA